MTRGKGNRGGFGGARQNGGRKPGQRNKRTQAMIAKAEAGGAMPLDIILKQMREADALAQQLAADKQPDQKAIKEAKDTAFERAKDAAPYLHPRLQSVTQKNVPFDLTKLTDDELKALLPILKRIERDKLGSSGDRVEAPGGATKPGV